MPEWLIAMLAALFCAHLVVFARLATRRGGAYYWLLTALFLALTASFTLRLAGPQWQLADQPLHVLSRYAAWAMALVTVPMLITRLFKWWRSRPTDESVQR